MPRRPIPTHMTDGDCKHAMKLLGERRLWDPEYKPPRGLSKLLKSKAQLEQFSQCEINRAFQTAVEENASLGLVQAFLAMGASVNFSRRSSFWKKTTHTHRDDGQSDALHLATRSGSHELVQLLAAYADRRSRDKALLTAIRHLDFQKTQMLLQSGTTPLIFDAAICRAALHFDQQTLEFLCKWDVEPKTIYSLAFARVMQAGEMWHSDSGLSVLHLLLQNGAQGDIVNAALLQAAELYLKGRASQALLDTLLHFHASVDYNDGHAVELAVKAGDIPPTLDPFVLKSKCMDTDEGALRGHGLWALPEKLLEIINVLCSTDGDKPDPNFEVPGLDVPPLFLALSHYPASPAVVRQMLDIGSHVDTVMGWRVFGEIESQQADNDLCTENQLILSTFTEDYGDQYDASKSIRAQLMEEESNTPSEEVSVLTWACCQLGEQMINAAVVEVLLEFQGKFSRSTRLHRADFSSWVRPDLVRLLLEQNVDTSVKDRFGRSALFYAAGNGDIESTMLILQNQPRVNDGSLHEAARELHPEILSALIRAGHDVNFTSTKHEGLTALGELAMYCKANGKESTVEHCIELLVQLGADPVKKWRGKTVLYMALDNRDPCPVTSALLERLMWKYVNHEANIYGEESLFYTPTMYLQKGYFRGPENVRNALIQLLRNHGAEDQYYAAEGLRQPHDAVGMPQHIIEAERRRRQHEEGLQRRLEEHETSLRQEWEAMQQRLLLQEAQQQQRLRHCAEEAQQQFEFQEVQQQQYLRHQAERFGQLEYHTVSMANTRAHIQYQQDYQSLQVELERIAMERESAQIQVEQEYHKLEIQWQANELQAEANDNHMNTQDWLQRFNTFAERERVAVNYQIQRQNVLAHSLIAMIEDRSQPEALAAMQEATIAEIMEEYPDSQLLIEYQ